MAGEPFFLWLITKKKIGVLQKKKGFKKIKKRGFEQYKTTNECTNCKAVLQPKDVVKTCQRCFNIYHTSCLDINSTKQWSCDECKEI